MSEKRGKDGGSGDAKINDVVFLILLERKRKADMTRTLRRIFVSISV